MSTTVLQASGLAKTYVSRRRRGARAARRRPRRRGRRVRRDHGPERLRQVDPAAPARRPRPPDAGSIDARRDARRPALGGGLGSAAPPRDRLRVPVLQPRRQPHRRRERRAARAARRRVVAKRRAGAARSCSSGSASRPAPTRSRRSSPAASSSGSRSHARSSTGRAVLLADEPTGNLDSAQRGRGARAAPRACTRAARHSCSSRTTRASRRQPTASSALRDGLIVDETRLSDRAEASSVLSQLLRLEV